MASKTVDPIDWSHPPPYTGWYPLSSMYCTAMRTGLQIRRLAALSQPRTCDLRSVDQRTACAATLGMNGCFQYAGSRTQLPELPNQIIILNWLLVKHNQQTARNKKNDASVVTIRKQLHTLNYFPCSAVMNKSRSPGRRRYTCRSVLRS